MKIIPAAKARSIFQEIIDDVHFAKKYIVITKHGKPWALLKPLPEDERLLQKLKSLPENEASLKKLKKQL